MAIRLCDEDRQRFGCAEWLEWSAMAVSIADLEWLSDKFGFDPDDWPTPLVGELTLEQAGDPDAKPKPPRWRNHAWAWMLLRQNGHPVTWEEAGEVRMLLARSKTEPVEEPGKGGGDTGASEPSEASTTPPSPSSSD